MKKALTIAAVCAGLAAGPLAVRAAELVVFAPDGQPVGVLVPVQQLTPVDLFAGQAAMLHHMMDEMAALDAFAGPQLVPAFAPSAMPQAGQTMVVTSFSDGRQSCSRTVIYQAQPNGAAPLVKVSQTGDACGAVPQPQPGATVPAAEPAPAPADSPRLIHVRYDHKTPQPAQYRG